MESQNTKNFDKLSNYKILSKHKSEVYIINFSFNLFNKFEDKENYEFLNFITVILNLIIEKTEEKISLNILFEEGEVKEDTPFKYFERIINYFYYIASLTKFIENKKFYVKFPQFTKDANSEIKDILNPDNIAEDQILYILDNSFKDIKLKNVYYFSFKENNLSYFTSDGGILTILKNIEKEIEYRNEQLKIFAYDMIVLGGSFDHMHLGHNVSNIINM